MAAPPGPSTPDTTPQRAMGINRSFTVPTKMATPPRPSNAPTELTSKDMEMLYKHPNARIIKFTAASSKPSSTNSPGRPQSSSGTLPWASPTESLQAAGPLEIYRVPVTGVSFLHAGTFLKPILKRSQCWCVDGVSKFAIAAGQDTYYRIELPGESDEDLVKVEELKATLQKVLFYEKTPCPFKRSFTVELPEENVLDVRKKRRRNTEGKAKKWSLNRAYGWRPEGWEPGMDEPEQEHAASGSADGSATGSEEETDSASGPEESDTIDNDEKDMPVKPSARAVAVEKLRSASAPQRSIPQSSTPSRLRTKVYVDGTVEVQEEAPEARSTNGEVPTLRTFQAIPTDMPPSPPDSSAGLDAPESQNVLDDVAVDQSIVVLQDTVAGAEKPEDLAPQDGDNGDNQDASQQFDSEDVDRSVIVSNSISESDDIQDSGLSSHRETHVASAVDAFEHGSATTATKALNATSEDQEARSEPEISNDDEDEGIRGVDDGSHDTGLLAETIGADDVIGDHVRGPKVAGLPTSDVPLSIERDREDEQLDGIQSVDQILALGHTEESPPTPDRESGDDHSEQDATEDRPSTPPNKTTSEDPYAAIQARILARRSLSGTTSFHPLHKSPTRSSTSSTSSSATIISNKAAKSSRRRARYQHGDDPSMTLVNRAYSTFLGPPAHLVAIMLKIAARFANGAFGVNSMFYVESPIDSPRKVPGSYRLRGDYIEEVYSSSEEEDEDWEDKEDDFGVPLDRPASNLAGLTSRERSARTADVD